MELSFDLRQVKTTVLGVGLDLTGQQEFRLVPVGADVQTALGEMAGATLRAMLAVADEPSPYEPAEKYASQEHLYVPLEDELAATMRELYEAESLTTDSNALSDPSAVFCYPGSFMKAGLCCAGGVASGWLAVVSVVGCSATGGGHGEMARRWRRGPGLGLCAPNSADHRPKGASQADPVARPGVVARKRELHTPSRLRDASPELDEP